MDCEAARIGGHFGESDGNGDRGIFVISRTVRNCAEEEEEEEEERKKKKEEEEEEERRRRRQEEEDVQQGRAPGNRRRFAGALSVRNEEMNFEEDDEWDLDLIDTLVRQEEEAIAARRGGTQAAPFSQPPLPFLLKHQVKEAAILLKTQAQSAENRPQSQQSHHHRHHPHPHSHHPHHRHHEVLLEEANDEEHLKSTVSQLQQRVFVVWAHSFFVFLSISCFDVINCNAL
jgi:hypothetical protein